MSQEMADKERIAELEEENMNLRNAVTWALACGEMYATEFKEGIRLRAFPPKFETVEIKRWECAICGGITRFSGTLNNCSGCRDLQNIIEMTGHYQRPIVAKVKKREEIPADCVDLTYHHLSGHVGKVFFEWEE